MTLTGYATGTAHQEILWFCHHCNWTGVLPAGQIHYCHERIRLIGRFAGRPICERFDVPIGSFATVDR